jgi:hypothetical protein
MTTTSDTPRTEAAKLEVLQVGRPARVKASFAEELERENQLLREELEQQAICNGAGASRELSLRTTIDALQKELCALRAALTGTLDRLEFYIDCLPIDKVAYLKTLEGKITNQVINNARAAIAAARKDDNK